MNKHHKRRRLARFRASIQSRVHAHRVVLILGRMGRSTLADIIRVAALDLLSAKKEMRFLNHRGVVDSTADSVSRECSELAIRYFLTEKGLQMYTRILNREEL